MERTGESNISGIIIYLLPGLVYTIIMAGFLMLKLQYCKTRVQVWILAIFVEMSEHKELWFFFSISSETWFNWFEFCLVLKSNRCNLKVLLERIFCTTPSFSYLFSQIKVHSLQPCSHFLKISYSGMAILEH